MTRAGELVEVEVTRLGAAGDGIGETPAGRVYLPGALPGEHWQARLAGRAADGWRGEALACRVAAARAEPVCPHFGRCGGCRLQHLPQPALAAHKRQRIAVALARRGFGGVPVAETVTAPLASRRCLRLGIGKIGGQLRLGLRARASHRLEPIDVCPIACPELQALLGPLAAGLASALAAPWPAELSLTATMTGIDLVLWSDRAASFAERERLAAMAGMLDLARLSWGAGEPLVVRRQPAVQLSGILVEPPPGSFLQATAFGEATLVEAVRTWSAGCRRAVDLFAGLGTLSFAVHPDVRDMRAYEADAAAVVALHRAASRAGWHALKAERRDLDRRPLAAAELKGRDLAILDPPRAGAAAQVPALAAARLRRIIYASCSPESFARDARRLVDGGFRLIEVRPIDQFLFAAEVELMALFHGPERA